MSISKKSLPQMNGGLFLTDGGIETTLIYHDGFDLPYFAAFDLFKDEKGVRALHRYFARHASIAKKNGMGFILESATWRASRDWAEKLGYSAADLEEVNRKAIHLLRDVKAEFETPVSRMVISGCIGPRGDGYDPGKIMSPEEAQAYHSQQVRIFADEEVDMISAITMTNTHEAIGITHAAQQAELPRHRQRAGLLHDQLCTSHPLRKPADVRRALGRAYRRHAGECLPAQSCRVGQGHRT
jgi:S-methylmethionine-dependent homocysteine/selenocysteine methylase